MGLESVERERLGYAELHRTPRAHRHETHFGAGSRQSVRGVYCLDCTGLFRWPFEIPGVKDSHVTGISRGWPEALDPNGRTNFTSSSAR